MTTEPYGEHRTIVMPRRRSTTRLDASVMSAVPRLGSVVGRYRLCLELASGGMSTVYLARVRDGVGLHRFAALKCLRPQLAADPELVERFVDEGRIASWIQHPNVCEVLDCHHDDGVTFLAMEFLRGQSLSAIRRALVADDVAGEVFQIATARGTSILQLVQDLDRAFRASGHPPIRVTFGPRRQGDVQENFADTRKALERLGWRAEVDLADGLARTVRWALGHMNEHV